MSYSLRSVLRTCPLAGSDMFPILTLQGNEKCTNILHCGVAPPHLRSRPQSHRAHPPSKPVRQTDPLLQGRRDFSHCCCPTDIFCYKTLPKPRQPGAQTIMSPRHLPLMDLK